MKRKQTAIPLIPNGMNIEKRMPKEETFRDVENIEIKKWIVKAIGTKIEKNT